MDYFDLDYGYPNRIAKVMNVTISGNGDVFSEEIYFDYYILNTKTNGLIIDLADGEYDTILSALKTYLAHNM